MMRSAGNTGALGLEIGMYMWIGLYGGEYLDGRFHSTPWMKWIGFAVVGVGCSINALVRVTRQYKKVLAREDQDPNGPKS